MKKMFVLVTALMFVGLNAQARIVTVKNDATDMILAYGQDFQSFPISWNSEAEVNVGRNDSVRLAVIGIAITRFTCPVDKRKIVVTRKFVDSKPTFQCK